MTIEVIQGDVSPVYKFQRKNTDGEPITSLPQKMWITFKEGVYTNEVLFQKTLEDGISYSEEDNYYRFNIKSEDTENMPYGMYGFDIAIINEEGEKKTLLNDGIFKVQKHYTKKQNEV